ncbi:MAG TPA: YggT family protein [Streptosporangiaceae bacterium]|jgi:YggT family protein
MLGIVKIVLFYVLSIYLVILLGRLIFSWIQTFSRSWTPSGPLLIVAEVVFTATDPPLRFLRRYIPAVRLGTVALDLSFMVLFFVVIFAMQAVTLL